MRKGGLAVAFLLYLNMVLGVLGLFLPLLGLHYCPHLVLGLLLLPFGQLLASFVPVKGGPEVGAVCVKEIVQNVASAGGVIHQSRESRVLPVELGETLVVLLELLQIVSGESREVLATSLLLLFFFASVSAIYKKL